MKIIDPCAIRFRGAHALLLACSAVVLMSCSSGSDTETQSSDPAPATGGENNVYIPTINSDGNDPVIATAESLTGKFVPATVQNPDTPDLGGANTDAGTTAGNGSTDGSTGSTGGASNTTGDSATTTSGDSTTSGTNTTSGANATTGGDSTTTGGDSTTTGGDSTTSSGNTTSAGNDSTGGDSTTAGSNTTSGGNDTTGGEATTSGANTTSGGNNTTSGEATTSAGNTTTGGNNTTGGDSTTSGSNTTAGGNDTTGGDSTTSGNNTTAGGNDTTGGDSTTSGNNTTSGGNNTTGADSTTAGDSTTSGGNNTTGGDSTTAGDSTTSGDNVGGDSTTSGENTTTGSTSTGGDTNSTDGSSGTGGATTTSGNTTGNTDSGTSTSGKTDNADSTAGTTDSGGSDAGGTDTGGTTTVPDEKQEVPLGTQVEVVPDKEVETPPSSALQYPGSSAQLDQVDPAKSQKVPDYLVPFDGPVPGTRITRISKNSVFNTTNGKAIHRYSKRQVWNADQTLLDVGGKLLDGETYEIVRQNIPISTARNWSNLDPDIMFGMRFNPQLTDLVTWNVKTDKFDTLHSFDSFSKCKIGGGEGNISNDDKFILIVCSGGSTGTRTMHNFDIVNRKIVSTLPAPSNYNWASVSPLGNYIIVDNSTIDDRELLRYDPDFTNKFVLETHPEHGDIGLDANGEEIYAQISWDWISYVQIKDGKRYNLQISDPRTNIVGHGHLSCRNVKRPGYCYFSAKTEFRLAAAKMAPGTNTSSYQDNGKRTVYDGASEVEQWGFHKSTSKSYQVSPKASVSPDGTKICFTSDWYGNGEINDYVLEYVQ